MAKNKGDERGRGAGDQFHPHRRISTVESRQNGRQPAAGYAKGGVTIHALQTGLAAMRTPPSALAISLAGLACLAVAMGVGRFAFTPLFPLMLSEGRVSLAEGGWLAGANYFGYLLGAFSVGRLRMPTSLLLRSGLVLVIATTALMALPLTPMAGAAWRLIAGIASAWVLIATSSLCLARLDASRAGTAFAGVGCGIAVSGIVCLAAAVVQMPSPWIWLLLAVVSLAASTCAWPLLRARDDAIHGREVPPKTSVGPTDRRERTGQRLLVFCYGLYGLGYILPATYLPAQARDLVTEPILFGLAWPAFGLAAAASTLLAGNKWVRALPRRTVWGAAQVVMAVGVLLPVLWPTLATIVAAAICVGGTFMILTMVGMQEAHAVAGRRAQRLMATMTAAFAVGQLAGPLVVGAVSLWTTRSLDVSMAIAAAALVLSTVLLRYAPTSPSSSSQENRHEHP